MGCDSIADRLKYDDRRTPSEKLADQIIAREAERERENFRRERRDRQRHA